MKPEATTAVGIVISSAVASVLAAATQDYNFIKLINLIIALYMCMQTFENLNAYIINLAKR